MEVLGGGGCSPYKNFSVTGFFDPLLMFWAQHVSWSSVMVSFKQGAGWDSLGDTTSSAVWVSQWLRLHRWSKSTKNWEILFWLIKGCSPDGVCSSCHAGDQYHCKPWYHCCQVPKKFDDYDWWQFSLSPVWWWLRIKDHFHSALFKNTIRDGGSTAP